MKNEIQVKQIPISNLFTKIKSLLQSHSSHCRRNAMINEFSLYSIISNQLLRIDAITDDSADYYEPVDEIISEEQINENEAIIISIKKFEKK